MANLTGQEIRNTYQGLLKTEDNNAIDASEKVVTDGLGNASAISLGTDNLQLTGGLKDFGGELGTSGQVLSSTGTGTDWVDSPVVSGAINRIAKFTGTNAVGNSSISDIGTAGATININSAGTAVFDNAIIGKKSLFIESDDFESQIILADASPISAAIWRVGTDGTAGNYLAFSTGGAAPYDNHAVISRAGGGRLGVGTTLPLEKLHLGNNGNTSPASLLIDSSTIADATAKFAHNGTVEWTIGSDETSGTTGTRSFVISKGSALGTDNRFVVTNASSVEIGSSAVASAEYSFASGSGVTASGKYSAAFGGFNTASGYYSFATGGYSNATGFYDVAMGFASTASGGYSTALNATAAGQRSFASASGYTLSSAYNGISMGYGTYAQGQYSVAIGGSMSSADTEAIGNYSIAMGAQASASGTYSTAIGAANVNFGGTNPNALGSASIALGQYASASGDYSLAINSGQASGYASFAINGATASGYYAVAISSGISPCEASGEQSVAIGVSCSATAPYSVVIGDGVAAHQSAICLKANSNRDNATFVNELSIMNIPTSAAGLPSGAVWSNAGVLNIVP